MRQLFLLLYKYRATLVFVGLELICAWAIVSQNIFLGASFFNSSNQFVATTLSTSSTIDQYFSLGEVNQSLSRENAELRKKLKSYEQSIYRLDVRMKKDPDLIGQYEFISGKVIDNSVHKVHNHVTINAGEKAGVASGMGVINESGVVGKIATTSGNYAVISSLLNADVMVSSKIKRTGHLGTINWSGKNIRKADLLYVPRHVQPAVGDTIITSGFNAVFPEGIIIGTISSTTLPEESNFHEIEVTLSNDYSKMSYVYVIKNNLFEEQTSVQDFMNTND